MSSFLFQSPVGSNAIPVARVAYVVVQDEDEMAVIDVPSSMRVVQGLESASVMEVVDSVCVYRKTVF